VCVIFRATFKSPIVNPPVTKIGTEAVAFAVLAIVAFEKLVAENSFPQDKTPV
jgi:hypothetical protein